MFFGCQISNESYGADYATKKDAKNYDESKNAEWSHRGGTRLLWLMVFSAGSSDGLAMSPCRTDWLVGDVPEAALEGLFVGSAPNNVRTVRRTATANVPVFIDWTDDIELFCRFKSRNNCLMNHTDIANDFI
jgi:hypothetical protein